MDMEPGIINVKQEVPGVGTMNQKVGFVSMLLSATVSYTHLTLPTTERV